jgi:hypothetical protein
MRHMKGAVLLIATLALLAGSAWAGSAGYATKVAGTVYTFACSYDPSTGIVTITVNSPEVLEWVHRRTATVSWTEVTGVDSTPDGSTFTMPDTFLQEHAADNPPVWAEYRARVDLGNGAFAEATFKVESNGNVTSTGANPV